MATIFANIDDAELAARLGSINTFDRRGNVICMDDFEGAMLKWSTNWDGLNAGVNLSTATARSGSQSCILTAGDGVNGKAEISRYMGGKILGKMGAEVSFTVNNLTTTIELDFRYFDGTYGYIARIIYDKAGKKFQYYNYLGNPVDFITGVNLRSYINSFHTMKLIIDTNSSEYVRFLCDDFGEDLSGLSLNSYGDARTPDLYFEMKHTCANANAKSIYVDDVIITQNEP